MTINGLFVILMVKASIYAETFLINEIKLSFVQKFNFLSNSESDSPSS